ncbi:MAG: hypothetical protein EKK45_03835 [Curvibacter sp.]|nr:MAG: hypothetical protein EKK45_03835 [Curvibacter sp.]
MKYIRSAAGAACLSLFLAGCGGGSSGTVENDPLAPSQLSAAVVEGFDTQDGLVQVDAGGTQQVGAGEASTIDIWGLNLRLGLSVTLGSSPCLVHDLMSFDDLEEDSDVVQISADCPAQAQGSTVLTVSDKGTPIYQAPVRVTAVSTRAARNALLDTLRPKFTSLPVASRVLSREQIRAALVASPGVVTGQITADAPTIDPASGGLIYSALRNFNVRGVVVQLLDVDNANAVMATTVTDANGLYTFSGVAAGKNVGVQVSAQVSMTRGATATTGPQYNFMLRDNTASGTVKPLYTLSSPTVQTVAAGNVVSLNAALGFDGNGNVTGARQSAPFSILDVVYNAATMIAATNPNVSLPDLNIYWSPNNAPQRGDLAQGQIGTSHFNSNGDYPGVYILGKANVDTDEFDQGVVGHEFGHYLQYAASYSDNPGGSHSSKDFKDASLAYGEGFGTAIGGLLAKSKYYSDSSGPNQSSGFSTDISLPLATGAGKTVGFYAENAIAYVLYTLGTQYGFNTFWNATTALANGHPSATIFSFLNGFVSQNPSLSGAVQALAASQNIRTLDALGRLPSGDTGDAAVASAANGGAADLETLYLPLTPNVSNGSKGVNLTPSAPSFCLNNNLAGAKDSNGLGMSKRFTFTAVQTGPLGVRMVDALGNAVAGGLVFANARGSDGKSVSIYGWNEDIGQFSVNAGTTYTLKVNLTNPATLTGGNQCGLTVSLWTPAS